MRLRRIWQDVMWHLLALAVVIAGLGYAVGTMRQQELTAALPLPPEVQTMRLPAAHIPPGGLKTAS